MPPSHPLKKPEALYKARILGFPEIDSVSDLSNKLRLPVSTINYYAYRNEKFGYKEFSIPKKPHGKRILHSPVRQLKFIQAWILRNILDKLNSSNAATAFEIGKNIATNARIHIGQSYIVNVDIKDFFSSTPAKKVYSIFRSIGYSDQICWTLTNLVTFNGFLPQGGPCSPKLANLICHRLDARLLGFSKKNNLSYSRYADDITVSTSSRVHIAKILRFLNVVIAEEGYSLRHEKTCILGRRRAKKVTGLVVSNEVRVGRKKYRELRAIIYTGIKDNDPSKISYAEGYLNFLKGIDNKTYRQLKRYWEKLASQHQTDPRVAGSPDKAQPHPESNATASP